MAETQLTRIFCPYCGEGIEIVIDCSIAQQNYIEDCSVCCRPISLHINIANNGDIAITPCHEND